MPGNSRQEPSREGHQRTLRVLSKAGMTHRCQVLCDAELQRVSRAVLDLYCTMQAIMQDQVGRQTQSPIKTSRVKDHETSCQDQHHAKLLYAVARHMPGYSYTRLLIVRSVGRRWGCTFEL